jgi:hypothetical protein
MENVNRPAIHINDLELVEDIGILFESEVVLYGAGFCGKEVFQALKMAGVQVLCFCDGDSSKWGQCIGGAEIIPPDKLKRLDNEKNLAIIVASNTTLFMEQIISDIAALELKTRRVYTKLSLEISLLQNINDNRICKMYRNFVYIDRQFLVPSDRYNCEKIKEIFKNKVMGDIGILVYQSGKVGSASIIHSLIDMNINCVHLHKLSLFHNKLSGIFENSKTIKIITLVREPINRALSLFFEGIYYIFSKGSFAEEGSYVNKIIEFLKKHSIYTLGWFDNELKTIFGIDIYAHPFDREKGYSIIKQGNVEVLAMKLEKLNSLESVIGEFVGAPQFKLISDNAGDNKIYKYLYKNVKDTIKIPREIFSTCYDDPKMSHFYSEEEKMNFLKKWEKNIVD